MDEPEPAHPLEVYLLELMRQHGSNAKKLEPGQRKRLSKPIPGATDDAQPLPSLEECFEKDGYACKAYIWDRLHVPLQQTKAAGGKPLSRDMAVKMLTGGHPSVQLYAREAAKRISGESVPDKYADVWIMRDDGEKGVWIGDDPAGTPADPREFLLMNQDKYWLWGITLGPNGPIETNEARWPEQYRKAKKI